MVVISKVKKTPQTSKKQKLVIQEQKEKLFRKQRWDSLLSGLNSELKEAITYGYNFANYRAKENDYLMIVEYKGKKYSEPFRTETRGYFIFTDLEDKFRAVKEMKEQIVAELELNIKLEIKRPVEPVMVLNS